MVVLSRGVMTEATPAGKQDYFPMRRAKKLGLEVTLMEGRMGWSKRVQGREGLGLAAYTAL